MLQIETRPMGLVSILVLHPRVIRSAIAFRRDPHDVLGRILDVAGFAMHSALLTLCEALGLLFLPAPADGRYFAEYRCDQVVHPPLNAPPHSGLGAHK